jgi:hypothetical protein
MKCEAFSVHQQSRSDLLVMKSSLPRLLIQVNLKPRKQSPEDFVRFILAGAAVVRFANTSLDAFEKKFVLFAIQYMFGTMAM